jgi:hypothetical protein
MDECPRERERCLIVSQKGLREKSQVIMTPLVIVIQVGDEIALR